MIEATLADVLPNGQQEAQVECVINLLELVLVLAQITELIVRRRRNAAALRQRKNTPTKSGND